MDELIADKTPLPPPPQEDENSEDVFLETKNEILDNLKEIPYRADDMANALRIRRSSLPKKPKMADVIDSWLRNQYNLKKYGLPCWQNLVIAVADDNGGAHRQLAGRLAQKYKEGIYTIKKQTMNPTMRKPHEECGVRPQPSRSISTVSTSSTTSSVTSTEFNTQISHPIAETGEESLDTIMPQSTISDGDTTSSSQLTTTNTTGSSLDTSTGSSLDTTLNGSSVPAAGTSVPVTSTSVPATSTFVPAIGKPPVPTTGKPPVPTTGKPPVPTIGKPPVPTTGKPPVPTTGTSPVPTIGTPVPTTGTPVPVNGTPVPATGTSPVTAFFVQEGCSQEDDKPIVQCQDGGTNNLVTQGNHCAVLVPNQDDYDGKVMEEASYVTDDGLLTSIAKAVHPKGKAKVSSPLDPYAMNQQGNHGYVLIINNINIDGKEERKGAKHDGSKLAITLKNLGYQLVDNKIHIDCTAYQIEQLIRKAINIDHTHNDSFICCLLSHGDSDYIYGTDDKRVYLDDIRKQVINCKSLYGKPKMFFVQACRGGTLPDAREVQVDDHSTPGKVLLPDACDVFFGYATSPNTKACRFTDTGSWYITELCKAFDNYPTQDLLTIVQIAQHEVCTRDEYIYIRREGKVDKSYRQSPQMVSTLVRKVYFKAST